MPKQFLRRNWDKYRRIGKGRRKLQKWRKPLGKSNKMRLGMKSYPKVVAVGYKKSEKERKKLPLVINNIRELDKIDAKEILIGKVGKKKKIELVNRAREKGIKILNLNVKKFFKKIEKDGKKENKKTEEKGNKTQEENKEKEKEKK